MENNILDDFGHSSGVVDLDGTTLADVDQSLKDAQAINVYRADSPVAAELAPVQSWSPWAVNTIVCASRPIKTGLCLPKAYGLD